MPAVRGQIGEIQQTARARSHKRKQLGNGREIGDIRQVANVPLEDRQHIGLKPGTAPRRGLPRNGQRIPPGDDSIEQFGAAQFGWLPCPGDGGWRKERIDETLLCALDLALRERPKRQHLHAAGQGFGELRQKHHVGRAGQQKAPGQPIPVDSGFDYWEEFRDMLNFIERDPAVQAGDETIGIAAGGGKNTWIVEGQVLAVLVGQLGRLHEGAFAGLTGSIQQNNRRIGQPVQETIYEVAPLHGRNNSRKSNDNQP